MKVPKEKCSVRIFCVDGSLLKGTMHVDEGLRVIDFVNDRDENFIAVTDVVVQNSPEVHSFQLATEMSKPKKLILLNKRAIKAIEEL